PVASRQRPSDSQAGRALRLSKTSSQLFRAPTMRSRRLSGSALKGEAWGSIKRQTGRGRGILAEPFSTARVQKGESHSRGSGAVEEKGEVGGGEVGGGPKEGDRPVARGNRQRGEAVGPPEVDGGPIDQVPVARLDRDRTPAAIAEVEVIRRRPGRAGVPTADPQVGGFEGAGLLGLGLEQADDAADQVGVEDLVSFLMVGAGQPAAEPGPRPPRDPG